MLGRAAGSPVRLLMCSLAAAIVAVGASASALPARRTVAAETPPPPPPDAPADAQFITTRRGDIVTVTFPSRVLTNARGEVVQLGDVHSCGSFGCFAWGINWYFGYYAFPHEVIDGCTNVDWSCTFRYLDGSPTGSNQWSRLDAALGYTRLAEGGTHTYYYWAPATHATVRVRGVYNESPVAPVAGDAAFLVRGGADATFASCATTAQNDPPSDATCIPMRNYGYGSDFSAIVPLGSGPWVAYGYLTGTSGLIANSPKRQFYFTNPPGTFGNANIVAVTGDVTVDLPWVGPGGSTTVPTTTSPPGATTTTTSVPGTGGGNAPQPPVVTSATIGSPGRVSGRVAGRPGATVHVTIAHHAGSTCARQMAGTGVTTVGAVDVVIEPDGESPFALPGAVPAGGWLYGTADSSAVGDCFAVDATGSLASLTPGRVLDTRASGVTIDGEFAAIGARASGAVTELPVAGRASVPGSASAVVLNVTVTNPEGPGYVTVWPCGEPRPTASSVNYVAGQTVANAVVAQLGSNGRVCLYTHHATDLVADVNGYFPAAASFAPLVPGRVLDSRATGVTVDGEFQGTGAPTSGSVTTLSVAGRAGVPVSASAVVLNVTVTHPKGPGYVTVWPCGEPRPTASNLNYVAGQTVANAVVSKVGADGRVCLYTHHTADVIADVNGFFPQGTSYVPLVPGRVLDTRPSGATVDGQSQGIGARESGSTTELVVASRAGVPGLPAAVVLNVTVTSPDGPGYVTVWPCDQPRPMASNLNYVAGQTVANAVVAKVSPAGLVCIYTHRRTEVVVDVNGYFPTFQ